MTGPHSKPVARWLGDASDLPQLWIASLQIGGASHRQANLFPRFPVLFLRVRIVELVFFFFASFWNCSEQMAFARRATAVQAAGRRQAVFAFTSRVACPEYVVVCGSLTGGGGSPLSCVATCCNPRAVCCDVTASSCEHVQFTPPPRDSHVAGDTWVVLSRDYRASDSLS